MESRESSFVLGQRYTFASLALALALLSFLNLAGLEKAILAIVLGLRALDAGSASRRSNSVAAGHDWRLDSASSMSCCSSQSFC